MCCVFVCYRSYVQFLRSTPYTELDPTWGLSVLEVLEIHRDSHTRPCMRCTLQCGLQDAGEALCARDGECTTHQCVIHKTI